MSNVNNLQVDKGSDVTKYHVAASGAKAGQLVPCNAKIRCRISSESEHVYFSDPQTVERYNELTAARDYGTQASDFTKVDAENLKKLEELSKSNERRYYSGDSRDVLENIVEYTGKTTQSRMNELLSDPDLYEASLFFTPKDWSVLAQLDEIEKGTPMSPHANLQEVDPLVKRAYIESLVGFSGLDRYNLDNSPHVDQLRKDPDPLVRLAMARYGDPSEVLILRGDPDDLRKQIELQQVRSLDGEVSELSEKLKNSSDRFTREELAKKGYYSKEFLQDPDPLVRKAAVAYSGEALFNDPSPDVRAESVKQALQNEPQAISYQIAQRFANDEYPQVRAQVALHTNEEKYAQDHDTGVRIELGLNERHSETLAKDTNTGVKLAVVEGLGRNSIAVQKEDSEEYVRQVLSSASTLSQDTSTEVKEALIGRLDEIERVVRTHDTGDTGTGVTRAEEELHGIRHRLLNDPNPYVKVKMMERTPSYSTSPYDPDRYIDDPSPVVRAAGIRLRKKNIESNLLPGSTFSLGYQDATRYASDPDPSVRAAALESFPNEMAPYLINDPDPRIKRTAFSNSQPTQRDRGSSDSLRRQISKNRRMRRRNKVKQVFSNFASLFRR